jgi:hypothetical protein
MSKALAKFSILKMEHRVKEFKYHRFLVSLRLVFAAFDFWLNNKVPKMVLITTILFFSYLAVQAPILFSQVRQFIIPSLQAVQNGSPETPLIIFSWSYVILFAAICMQHKQVAFNAAIQLYRRFGIKWAP